MDQTLTQQNFMTTLRYLITALGAYATAKGWISDEALNTTLGLIAIVGPLLWGMMVNYRKAQTLKDVAVAGVASGIAHAEDASMNTVQPEAITPTVAKAIISSYTPVKG